VPSPTQHRGTQAEQAAGEFLCAQGLTVLQRNFRRRAGELDLVARDGNVLVIAEVRLRTGRACGRAAASINTRKQRRIVRAAQQLLQCHPEYRRLAVRFDALLIEGQDESVPRITWIRHAFDLQDARGRYRP